MTKLLADYNILVVEDEFAVATQIDNVLSGAGAIVVGPMPIISDETRDLCHDIDAAVLDINLRGDMSFDFADWLRERDIPVVFSTGYDPFVIPLRHASVPIVAKPCQPERLIQALVSALSDSSAANARLASASGTP